MKLPVSPPSLAVLLLALATLTCPPQVPAQTPPASAEELTLNLKDADILALINTVSEVTGRNFIIDPRVKGKVTVVSATPTSKETLYDLFLSILNVYGFVAVEQGGVTKILPDATGKFAAPPGVVTRPDAPNEELLTAVLELKHVNAAQMVPILRPLLPQTAHLAAHQDSNTLIIADVAANIERMTRIIRRLDRDDADDLEIIMLENADADYIVGVIRSLRGPGADKAKTGPQIVADKRTNSILLSGTVEERARLREIIERLDGPVDSSGNMEVIYLEFALATEMVQVLTSVGTTMQQQQGSGGGGQGRAQAGAGRTDLQIVADEATNALVIQAPRDIMAGLKSVIEQLDKRREQVLVEGILAEVSTSKAAELGIQWRTSATGDGYFAGQRLPGTETGAITDPNTGSEGGTPFLTGLTVGYFTGGDIRALLRVLGSDGFTNVLSTPSLVTLENTEAEIVVGQNVPFITGQFTNNATTPDNPFQTIERQDVGIVLRVKPQINAGDTVTLEIEQEVSSIAPATSGSDLITNKRSINTTVLVNDGQTIVLGGLVEDDLRESVQKIPLLGDLPLVGRLFKNERADLVKRNLLVFLRPLIIRDSSVAESASRDRYGRLQDFQQEQSEGRPGNPQGIILMPGEDRPILPSFDGLME